MFINDSPIKIFGQIPLKARRTCATIMVNRNYLDRSTIFSFD
jgi:hypothetical protein